MSKEDKTTMHISGSAGAQSPHMGVGGQNLTTHISGSVGAQSPHMGVGGQNFSLANPMTYTLLKEKADYNRRHMTDAERMVWEFLRPCLSGIRFRNQFIIGDYIVDFVALKQKIIIEIDGEYHFDKEQRDLDLEREEYLIKSGFKIIRFTNDTVLNHMEDVIREIKSELH